MDYLDGIVSKIADRVCEKIAKKVMWHLQRMTNAMLSDDDSPLKNTWDEICVQVQYEDSFYWEMYVDFVEQYIEDEVNDLPLEIKQAIWLQTQEGMDWAFHVEDDHDRPRKPEPFEEDIVHYIFDEYITFLASTWTNRRIEQYING